MSKSGTIIIVDDNKGVLTAIQILLKSYFSKVVALSSPVTLTSVLREEMPEVVLLDMNFTSGINTGNEGLFWLHEIKKYVRIFRSYFLRLMLILNWLSGVLKREQRTLSSNPGTTRNWWKHCKPQQPLRTTTGKRQVKKSLFTRLCTGEKARLCNNYGL